MDFSTFVISALNGVSYGLLLFMLSSGLTLIFGMMGVLNFAHASFYMLGAYLAYSITRHLSFFWALLLAPLLVAAIGALVEKYCLRRVHKFGHVAELLVTFGLSYVLLEAVQLIWGRTPMDYRVPEVLQGAMFTLVNSSSDGLSAVWGAALSSMCKPAMSGVVVRCTQFPIYRGFMMLLALLMLASVWLLIARTRIGLIIQAALTHPQMAEGLGHNVPRIFTLVFAGGAALAGLAGVIGGNAFITEPGMAITVGAVVFVIVVVGGMGSLGGAFVASLLIGLIQTFAVAIDISVLSVANRFLDAGWDSQTPGYSLMKLTIAQIAPTLPYLLMVLVLIFRPQGLVGRR